MQSTRHTSLHFSIYIPPIFKSTASAADSCKQLLTVINSKDITTEVRL